MPASRGSAFPPSRAPAFPPSRARAFPPPGSIARFSDHVVAHDLPALPADRRAETVAFAGRRIAVLPSPIKLGVGAVAIAVDGLGRVFGLGRLVGLLADRPVPVLGEYVRLVRSLVYAYVWDTWPDTDPDGAPSRVPRVPVKLDADVLVVGSGAGGAPTAALLAEAGFDVLVLEEGEMVRQGDVVPFSLEQMDRQYRAGGVTAALGLPSIAYTEGCCAGGGTEVNSGLYRRPPEAVLDRWRRERQLVDFDADELFRICDEVELELSVQTVPGAQTPASEALRRGAAALDWRHDEIPRWMTYPAGGDARSGRRQSMTETYLPRATSAGARLLTGHRVDRLVLDGKRAMRAAVTGPDGAAGTVDFRDVVICGGAIQTPALLQRSGLRHNIGGALAVHPTVKLAARFDEAVNVPDDVPVHQVKEFSPDLSFGGSASSAGLVALALSDEWERFGPAIVDWEHLAVYYAAITSEGRGRVQAIPGLRDPLVTYRLTGRDKALLGRGLARLALLMLEAGATEVYPSYRGAPIVRRPSDLATLQGTFGVSKAAVMTVHLCSTVPFGEDRRAATDSFGVVRGTANVRVNDASLLPDAPGVNPQASVMAVAIRNARRFVETVKP